jgi:glutamine cyclotransferase
MTAFQRYIASLLGAALLVAGCGSAKSGHSTTTESETQVTIAKIYDYRIIAEYPHSTLSYTQGLHYLNGTMWESTGQEGESHILQSDLRTGERTILASLDKSEFGEGMTILGERIYQLTWTSGNAYVYDLEGRLLNKHKYRGEGWGLTSDGSSLYLSDGTSTIRRVNPETFATEESICVSLDGEPLDYINELEWIDGHIWANIYLTDIIVEIDTATGKVTGFVDLEPLRDLLKNNPQAEALNGIAYNAKTKHFYVTGKDWNTLFELEIIK